MSDDNIRGMPLYRSHKQVRALKIESIIFNTLAAAEPLEACVGAVITPEDKLYAPFPVSYAYVQKHNPQPGGYFVQYEDGYTSWSPADAFEGGYTRIMFGLDG